MLGITKGELCSVARRGGSVWDPRTGGTTQQQDVLHIFTQQSKATQTWHFVTFIWSTEASSGRLPLPPIASHISHYPDKFCLQCQEGPTTQRDHLEVPLKMRSQEKHFLFSSDPRLLFFTEGYWGSQAEPTAGTQSQQEAQARHFFLPKSFLPCHWQWARGGKEWNQEKENTGETDVNMETKVRVICLQVSECRIFPTNHQKLGKIHGINSSTKP